MRDPGRLGAFSAIFAFLLTNFGTPRSLNAAEVEPISLAARVSTTPSGDSGVLDISADGNLLIVASSAANLTTNRNDGRHLNLCLISRRTGEAKLITKSTAGTTASNGSAGPAFFADDEQWITFESNASNLVPNDTNDVSDVFLYNVQSGEIILASPPIIHPAWRTAANSSDPMISTDGRYVVFETTSQRVLGPYSTNGLPHIARFDRQTHVVEVVSVGTGNQPRKTDSGFASMSVNGELIVFSSGGEESVMTNVITGRRQVYLRDMVTKTTTWVSEKAGAVHDTMNGAVMEIVDADNPVISRDGSIVYFTATGRTSFRTSLLRWKRADGSLELVGEIESPQSQVADAGPVINFAGDKVAYVFEGELLVANTGQQPEAVNLTSEGESSDGLPSSPVFSDDGRFLFFASDATDLDPSATNGSTHIYRANLATSEIKLVSAQGDGSAIADTDFWYPIVSATGRYAAFETANPNVAPNDFNQAMDAFVRDLDTGWLELVTRTPAGLEDAMGNGPSGLSQGAVSEDGSLVFFSSSANNLLTNQVEAGMNIYLRNRMTDTTSLAGLKSAGDTWLGASAYSFSSSGNSVAFSAMGTNGTPGLYISDLPAQTTRLVYATNQYERRLESFSANADLTRFALLTTPFSQGGLIVIDQAGNIVMETARRGPAAISLDGQFVAYGVSNANAIIVHDLTRAASNVYNLPTGTAARRVRAAGNGTALVETTGGWFFVAGTVEPQQITTNIRTAPVINSSGHVLVYPRLATNGLATALVVTNRRAGLSWSIPVPAQYVNLGFDGLAISPNGQYLTARLRAVNALEGTSPLLIFNLVDGTSEVVTNEDTGGADSFHAGALFSGDSRTVVYGTTAALWPSDRNGLHDIYAVSLQNRDSDDDDLPDAWEMTVFGNLAKTSMEDSDGDGVNNLREYRGGSNPLVATSTLSISSAQLTARGTLEITWPAVAGRSYEIQRKSSLLSPSWETVTTVTTTSSTGSAELAIGGDPSAFYRLLTQ